MDVNPFELVALPSGVYTLRSVEHDETYHPVVGPMAEAREMHVAQQRIAERSESSATTPFVVWDVGFGAAANAIAVLESVEHGSASRRVELHSFDRTLAPLDFALSHQTELGYLVKWADEIIALKKSGMHRVGRVDWHLHAADFRDAVTYPAIPSPNAVMFDPYSPASNPELWNLRTFAAIRQRVLPGRECTLSSYSRSTAVRVTLLLAGWFVGRGRATGEKVETTIAASERSLLEAPLTESWLDRVGRSTAPGPLTNSKQPGMSGPEVVNQLHLHPQFAARPA